MVAKEEVITVPRAFVVDCAKTVQLLKNTLTEKDKLIEKLTQELSHHSQDHSEDHSQDHRENHGETERQVHELENVNETYKNMIMSFEHELEHQKENINMLEKDVEHFKQQAQEKEGQVQRLQADYRVQIRKLHVKLHNASTHEKQLQVLEKEYQRNEYLVSKQNQDYQNEINNLKSINRRLKKEIKNVKKRLANKQPLNITATASTAGTGATAATVAAAVQNLKQKFQTELENSKQTIKHKDNTIKSLSNTVASNKREISELNRQIKIMENAFNQIKNINGKNSQNNIVKVFQNMQDGIDERNQTISQLKSKISKQFARIEPLKHDKQYYQIQATDLMLQNEVFSSNINETEITKKQWLNIIENQHQMLQEVLHSLNGP